MKWKVCGMREKDNVNAVARLKPDWIGFIFYSDSPRCFLHAQQEADLNALPSSIKKVGVFVNQPAEEVIRICHTYSLDYAQLHGDEPIDYCRGLQQERIKIIKAFRIEKAFDFPLAEQYTPFVELFLFDAQGKSYGGNGVTFPWEILEGRKLSRRFLLSGGIGTDQISSLQQFRHPDLEGVDVNSRFETAPGLKDVAALQLFQKQIADL